MMRMRGMLVSWMLGILLLCPATAEEPDPARVAEIAAWLTSEPEGAEDPSANRLAFTGAVEQAAKLAAQPIPKQPDELFLDFSQTGNRDRWQRVAFSRRGRIPAFVAAECLENQGRFIAPLEEIIAAVCEEKTWVLPAHDRALDNFEGRNVTIDLGSSTLAWEIATADALLGDKLSPDTRRLIRENLEHRIFVPFRNSVRGHRGGNRWLTARENWNAVCLAGVTGASLAIIKSPKERAWFIAAAENYIQNYLQGFTPDGYCSEGLAYWNYGFRHFVLLSETIRRATGGRLDLLASPQAAKPALFGARTEILAGIYPSVSDCSPGVRPGQPLMNFLSGRFGFPLPSSLAENSPKSPIDALLLTDADGAASVKPDESALRTWFPQGGLLICRPGADQKAPFAACLKGGNNGEDHNHNDIGTFMVVGGKTMLLCDPGGEVYTARTFDARRYESRVINSFGHPVPVMAGRLQREGAAARGVVLATKFTPQQDTLRLDMKSAYGVPELDQLEREFVFRRGSEPSLTVTDAFRFSKPSTYETALITWGQWQRVSDRQLIITDGADSIRIEMDSGGAAFDVQSETMDEDVRAPRQPTRIALRWKDPVARGQFRLTITPGTASNP